MISIILIVKNDRNIQHTLAKLTDIKKPQETEIIVVDASEGALDDIKKSFPDIRWIYFHNIEKKNITIPEQRNLGLKEAKGVIIIFLDSDCIPDNLWLLEIIKPINNENESIVAGRVINSDSNSLHSQEIDKHLENKYLGEAPTMNLAAHRKVFTSVGCFDINFSYGEDVDFLWRAILKGYRIRYAKKAIIYHNLGDNNKEMKRLFRYGVARVQLYRKHTYRIKYFIGNEIFKIYYPLFFAFLPIVYKYPLYILLVLPILYSNANWKLISIFKDMKSKTIYGAGILYGLILHK